VVVHVELSRIYGYYVWKMGAILFLIVVMSWTAFFMPAESFPDRTTYGVTLFLAAVAFHFAISSSIPRVSYMTLFDMYLLTTYGGIGTVVVENLISYLYFTHGANESVGFLNKVDFAAVIIFPGTAVVLHAYYAYRVWAAQRATERRRRSKLVTTKLRLAGAAVAVKGAAGGALGFSRVVKQAQADKKGGQASSLSQSSGSREESGGGGATGLLGGQQAAGAAKGLAAAAAAFAAKRDAVHPFSGDENVNSDGGGSQNNSSRVTAYADGTERGS
jgi:hypothetical protein